MKFGTFVLQVNMPQVTKSQIFGTMPDFQDIHMHMHS